MKNDDFHDKVDRYEAKHGIGSYNRNTVYETAVTLIDASEEQIEDELLRRKIIRLEAQIQELKNRRNGIKGS